MGSSGPQNDGIEFERLGAKLLQRTDVDIPSVVRRGHSPRIWSVILLFSLRIALCFIIRYDSGSVDGERWR